MADIPDLGAIGRPQQIPIGAAALVLNAPNLPPELIDGAHLVALVRMAVREELERLLAPESHGD